jgi:hypothetical protein
MDYDVQPRRHFAVEDSPPLCARHDPDVDFLRRQFGDGGAEHRPGMGLGLQNPRDRDDLDGAHVRGMELELGKILEASRQETPVLVPPALAPFIGHVHKRIDERGVIARIVRGEATDALLTDAGSTGLHVRHLRLVGAQ